MASCSRGWVTGLDAAGAPANPQAPGRALTIIMSRLITTTGDAAYRNWLMLNISRPPALADYLANGWIKSPVGQTGKMTWAASSRSCRKIKLREHAEGDARPGLNIVRDVPAAPVRTLP